MYSSLVLLGSADLHQELVEDVEHLIHIAVEKEFRPLMLVVGPLFMYVGAIQSIIQDNQIKNWPEELQANRLELTRTIQEKILLIYQLCDLKSGKFTEEDTRKIDIYFDPDELYLNLLCVDPKTQAQGDELRTRDGYLIVSVAFPADDTLSHFLSYEVN